MSPAPSAISEVSSDDNGTNQWVRFCSAQVLNVSAVEADLFGTQTCPINSSLYKKTVNNISVLRFRKGSKPFENRFSNCDSRRRPTAPNCLQISNVAILLAEADSDEFGGRGYRPQVPESLAESMSASFRIRGPSR
jgi:hypothetical protein